MRKYLFLFAVIAVISLFSTKNSSAQALTYDVINNTGFTLVDIFVTPSETEHWGNDILPNSLFENGSTVTVTIPADYGQTCMFDMKITDTAGNFVVFSNIDACKLVTLQINGDGTYQYLATK
ncbi:MAG TPA: hypothetical protein VN514_04990 [Ignavibacteria bacterium]|nr:hypothetical protein [Ignavibacteria bacterium]